MTDGQLAMHMARHHAPYVDDGRVISVDEYRRLIHEQDHEMNDGLLTEHTHKESEA